MSCEDEEHVMWNLSSLGHHSIVGVNAISGMQESCCSGYEDTWTPSADEHEVSLAEAVEGERLISPRQREAHDVVLE